MSEVEDDVQTVVIYKYLSLDLMRFYTNESIFFQEIYKDGFVFLYWTLNGEKVTEETPFIENVLLKPYFIEKEEVTITFNTDGGDNEIAPIIVQRYVPTSEPLYTPTKVNHHFIGRYLNGIEFKQNETIVEDNIVLTAYWEPLETVSITFEMEGGNPINPVNVPRYSKVYLEILHELFGLKFIKEGHRFSHFLLDGEIFEYQYLTRDITLVAVWEVE